MDIANDIVQGNDGALYTVGYSYSSDGNFSSNYGWEDAKIIKTKLNGIIEWEVSLGGADADVFSCLTTSNNNIIAAGWTASENIPGINNLGSEDALVAKYNQDGELIWIKNYGGNSSDRINQIISLKNGNYILVGYTYSTDLNNITHLGSTDFWMIKINEQGELLWQHNYGGSDDDFAVDVIEAKNGDLIIAGNSNSIDYDVMGNNGEWDAWIVRTNSSGGIIWQQNYGNIANDEVTALIELPSSEILLTGNSFSKDNNSIGKSDGWLLKLSNEGVLLSEQKYGGKENDFIYSISFNNNSEILLAGITYSEDGDINHNEGNGDGWLINLDANDEEVLWVETFGGHDLDDIQNAIYTNSGSIAIAGNSKSQSADVAYNNGDWDIWTLELNGQNLEIKDNDILLFPNPTSNNLNFILNEEMTATITIIDISGKMVYSKNINDMNKGQINVSNLPNGIYTIQCVNDINAINKVFVKM